ncbi:uncharacterized protein LOC135493556 [Lineus longissimus]|uniref:uncharacterized protein LOC135493556 n=1 Tax=Lineus longissimus TaxID=88925 RepID=UPI00315D43D2
MANNNVDWTFIPKRAPWWGGFYERLVGLVKTTLKKVLGRAFVTLDEMNTFLCEIECVLNNRPLTYVYGDDKDALALTPAHLLHGRLLNTLPHVIPDSDEIMDPTNETRATLTKRSTILGEIQRSFWIKWEHEYLTALRERHDRVRTGKLTNTIKPGDVVLVHADMKKRLMWDLAVVESLITGNDGIARAANIRTKNGRTNRPITKLYPLEVQNRDNCEQSSEKTVHASDKTRDNIDNSGTLTTKTVTDNSKNRRPTRESAKRTLLKILNWLSGSD